MERLDYPVIDRSKPLCRLYRYQKHVYKFKFLLEEVGGVQDDVINEDIEFVVRTVLSEVQRQKPLVKAIEASNVMFRCHTKKWGIADKMSLIDHGEELTNYMKVFIINVFKKPDNNVVVSDTVPASHANTKIIISNVDIANHHERIVGRGETGDDQISVMSERLEDECVANRSPLSLPAGCETNDDALVPEMHHSLKSADIQTSYHAQSVPTNHPAHKQHASHSQNNGGNSEKTREVKLVQIGGVKSVQTSGVQSVLTAGVNLAKTSGAKSVQTSGDELEPTSGVYFLKSSEINSVQADRVKLVQMSGVKSVQASCAPAVDPSHSVHTVFSSYLSMCSTHPTPGPPPIFSFVSDNSVPGLLPSPQLKGVLKPASYVMDIHPMSVTTTATTTSEQQLNKDTTQLHPPTINISAMKKNTTQLDSPNINISAMKASDTLLLPPATDISAMKDSITPSPNVDIPSLCTLTPTAHPSDTIPMFLTIAPSYSPFIPPLSPYKSPPPSVPLCKTLIPPCSSESSSSTSPNLSSIPPVSEPLPTNGMDYKAGPHSRQHRDKWNLSTTSNVTLDTNGAPPTYSRHDRNQSNRSRRFDVNRDSSEAPPTHYQSTSQEVPSTISPATQTLSKLGPPDIDRGTPVQDGAAQDDNSNDDDDIFDHSLSTLYARIAPRQSLRSVRLKRDESHERLTRRSVVESEEEEHEEVEVMESRLTRAMSRQLSNNINIKHNKGVVDDGERYSDDVDISYDRSTKAVECQTIVSGKKASRRGRECSSKEHADINSVSSGRGSSNAIEHNIPSSNRRSSNAIEHNISSSNRRSSNPIEHNIPSTTVESLSPPVKRRSFFGVLFNKLGF